MYFCLLAKVLTAPVANNQYVCGKLIRIKIKIFNNIIKFIIILKIRKRRFLNTN